MKRDSAKREAAVIELANLLEHHFDDLPEPERTERVAAFEAVVAKIADKPN